MSIHSFCLIRVKAWEPENLVLKGRTPIFNNAMNQWDAILILSVSNVVRGPLKPFEILLVFRV